MHIFVFSLQTSFFRLWLDIIEGGFRLWLRKAQKPFFLLHYALAYCRDAAFLLHLHRPRHHPLLYQIKKTIRTQIRRIHPLQHPHLQLLLPRLPLMNLSSRHLVMCFRRVLPPKMNKFPYFLIMKRRNPILLYIPKLWDVFSIPLCKAPKIFL